MSDKKTIRIFCYLGLTLLVISQILLAQGFEFLADQSPIDFAHWSMLIGVVCLLGFNFVFSNHWLDRVASIMLVIGSVAHIGMCAIDFILWSFGNDFSSRDLVVGQMLGTTSIAYPFLYVGPAMLYIALSLHGWRFIKPSTLPSLMAILGSAMIGAGQFLILDRTIVVIGTVIMSAGLIWLIQKHQKE